MHESNFIVFTALVNVNKAIYEKFNILNVRWRLNIKRWNILFETIWYQSTKNNPSANPQSASTIFLYVDVYHEKENILRGVGGWANERRGLRKRKRSISWYLNSLGQCITSRNAFRVWNDVAIHYILYKHKVQMARQRQMNLKRLVGQFVGINVYKNNL